MQRKQKVMLCTREVRVEADRLKRQSNIGGCEEEVRRRVGAGWGKWRDTSGIVCDKRMPTVLKAAVYKTVIRPVLMYGSETWPLRRADKKLLERTEMRILRQTTGIKRIENIRNEEIRARAGVANISEKIREARLRWLGHVARKTEEDAAVPRCSNENTEDGSGWTPTYRKTETEVE